MKMKKYLILVMVSLIAIAGTAIGTGETQKPSGDKIIKRLNFWKGVLLTQMAMFDTYLNLKSPLYGIREVVVLVEELPQEAERYGLTRQALQTDTELRLRQYGIKVVTKQENDRRFMEHIRQVAAHKKHGKKRVEDFLQAEEKKVAEDMKRIKEDFLQDKDYKKFGKAAMQFTSSHDKRFSLFFIELISWDESIKDSFKRLISSLYDDESDEHFEKCVIEYLNCIQEYQNKSCTSPTLYINVLPLIFEGPRVAVANIRIEVHTETFLRMGSSSVSASAVLWKRGSIMSRGLDNISEIRDTVRDMVDEFINDYLAANPTKKPTVSPSTTKPPQKGLISAIVYSENNPSAVINDTTVHEGDDVDGVTVVKIYKDRVVFQKEGREKIIRIRWTQKIGEAPKAHRWTQKIGKAPKANWE